MAGKDAGPGVKREETRPSQPLFLPFPLLCCSLPSFLLLLRWPYIMHQQLFVHAVLAERKPGSWRVGDGAPPALGVQRLQPAARGLSSPPSRLSSPAPTRGWAGDEGMGVWPQLSSGALPKFSDARFGQLEVTTPPRSARPAAVCGVPGTRRMAQPQMCSAAWRSRLSSVAMENFPPPDAQRKAARGAAMGAAAPAPCPAPAVAVPGADFGFCLCHPWGWLQIAPVRCCGRASSPTRPCGDEDLAQALGSGLCAGAGEVLLP